MKSKKNVNFKLQFKNGKAKAAYANPPHKYPFTVHLKD